MQTTSVRVFFFSFLFSVVHETQLSSNFRIVSAVSPVCRSLAARFYEAALGGMGGARWNDAAYDTSFSSFSAICSFGMALSLLTGCLCAFGRFGWGFLVFFNLDISRGKGASGLESGIFADCALP